jgi:1,4-dihydroxy-2-naphthoate octaprenyltransferase
VFTLGGAMLFAWLLDRPLTPLFAVLMLAAMWLYSFRPARVSYRGGGELLQGAASAVLMLWGFEGQAGTLAGFPWPLLLPFTALNVVANIIAGFADHPSDAAAGKRSFTVRHGTAMTRRTVLLASGLSIVTLPLFAPRLSAPAMALVVAAGLWPWLRALRVEETRAFAVHIHLARVAPLSVLVAALLDAGRGP